MWAGVAVRGADSTWRRLRGADLFAAWRPVGHAEIERAIRHVLRFLTPSASVRGLIPQGPV